MMYGIYYSEADRLDLIVATLVQANYNTGASLEQIKEQPFFIIDTEAKTFITHEYIFALERGCRFITLHELQLLVKSEFLPEFEVIPVTDGNEAYSSYISLCGSYGKEQITRSQFLAEMQAGRPVKVGQFAFININNQKK